MATTPAPGTSSQSTLSDWAGGYVTDMLGKAQAISDQPYQVYQGPMTAGQSNLQSKVFQGLGSLNFPGNLGQSFSSGMGGNTNSYGGPGGPAVMPQQGGVPNYAMSGDYTGGKGFSPDTNNPLFAGVGAMPPGGSDLYSPQVMPQQGPRGFNQGPRTEADWNRFSSMAQYAPGTDMAKEKADFLAGGQGGMPPQTLPSYAPSTPRQDYGSPQGIAGLTAPQTSQQPSNIAQSYMNPYLESVLAPQMEELRRQSQINLQPSLAKLTQAGGYGGGRQAIMESEANRNLLSEQNKTVGQGYASAYDKAMGQFNTEQGQSKDLVNMLANAGQAERGIEQEGITADYNEFLAQRDYPMKQTQYLQSMLQGLPISTVSTSPASQTGLGSLQSTVGTLGSTYDLLKKLKVIE